MRFWTRFLSLSVLLAATAGVAHAERVWDVTDATVTLSMNDSHLAGFGLQVVDARAKVADNGVLPGLGGTPHAFAADPAGLRFRSEGGRFEGFEGGHVALPFRGGLAFRAEHPALGKALAPVLLYDFVLDYDPARDRDPFVIRSATSAFTPIVVRNAGFHLDEKAGELSFRMGDLQISPEWAEQLEQPKLAGQWIGGFDLRLHAMTASPQEAVADAGEYGTDPNQNIDVLLAELYGISSLGHNGTYPNGVAGLSAATTSCNPGQLPVPWNAPMAETHPFIGLALFREKNGVLEMIGKNWIKHGFFALSNNQCNLGCSPTGGNYLGVGCSDTYSVSNNGSRYYLGPREEVDPFAGTWVACGSFFDEPVIPDPDCNRNYNDNETDQVIHRLVVRDADLANPGATYYYEGEYIVADDAKPQNNIGWRQCTMSWGGGNWNFSTVGGGLDSNLGLLVETWGDVSKRKAVGPDDGEVVLSNVVTDLGGGQYHYEYALYNWRSARGVYSISIPVGSANLTNIGFHDIDTNAGNDWQVTLAGGMLTFATDDYVTNPNANALDYQTMFNFRFDADVPAVSSEAIGRPFRPGVGTEFTVVTTAPSGAPATDVAVVPAVAEGLQLRANEPNPFAHGTRLSFALPSEQPVRVAVYDIAGRAVRTLFDGVAPAGESQLRWDGRDANGSEVASGVYFFRLDAAEGSRSVKGTLMR